MKQSIRFFSIGLLTASLVLLGFYFLIGDKKVSSKDVPLEDMIAEIEANGHRVITEKEFIAFTLNNEEEDANKEEEANKKETKADKDKKENSDDKKKKKSKDKKDSSKKKKSKDKDDKDEKDKVIKAKFTTDDGVVTQDIADILIDEKIIDDRQKFLDYLDDNDYSAYIQIGTFEVTSDMSMKEIAEVITTYPGD